MVRRLFLFALCLSMVIADMDINFLDCPKKKNSWSWWRRCCVSPRLPNNCECFDIWSSDFTNSMYHLPVCPDELKVKFRFFDRDHKQKPVNMQSGKKKVLKSFFKADRGTVTITHGFNDKGSSPWAIRMKDALLKTADLNVIIVDWEYAASGANYYQPVANTRAVGAMLARLILDLQKFKDAQLKDFHLVGHSLGAHVCGIAGKEIERLTGNKIGRITGLDPAGPSFEDTAPTVRLDKSDADFVSVIHTDGEPLLSS
ncbi:pancreatic lipase-related protein 2, partial [Elysia marginata]